MKEFKHLYSRRNRVGFKTLNFSMVLVFIMPFQNLNRLAYIVLKFAMFIPNVTQSKTTILFLSVCMQSFVGRNRIVKNI